MNTRTVRDEYYGYVNESFNRIVHISEVDKKIYFFIPAQKNRRFTEEIYSIHFNQNRYPLALEHRALNVQREQDLINLLFPTADVKYNYFQTNKGLTSNAERYLI